VPGDLEIAKVMRASAAPALLAINKTDDRRARGVMEFHQLGFDPVLEISAEHGEGIGDLLDAVVDRLPPGRIGLDRHASPDGERAENGPDPAERPGRDGATATADSRAGTHPAQGLAREVGVAIVGRPNAGKSSLVNRLLREERMIVSETPGTTRDAVDTVLTWHRRQFRIVDTAGIRRPGRVARGGQVESVSVLLARRSIEAADVVVLVVDASQGATDQDAAIAGEADRAGRGVVVAANKWDLMKDRGPEYVKEFDEEIRRQLKFLDYAPVLHISAATGERTPRLLEAIDTVAASRRTRVKTPALNRVVERITLEHPPQSPGRRHVRILYAAQTTVAPPTFVFFTNIATTFHFSYARFLENRIREEFGFIGTPIRIQVRARRSASGSTKDSGGRRSAGSKPTRRSSPPRRAARRKGPRRPR
jgi:GTP-binding protein